MHASHTQYPIDAMEPQTAVNVIQPIYTAPMASPDTPYWVPLETPYPIVTLMLQTGVNVI